MANGNCTYVPRGKANICYEGDAFEWDGECDGGAQKFPDDADLCEGGEGEDKQGYEGVEGEARIAKTLLPDLA